MHTSFKIPLLTALLSLSAAAEKFLELDFGFTVAKSALGLSYTMDRNEINVGLKAFAFTNGGEYALMPGVSYNRYFTDNGFFGTLTYAPVYRQAYVQAGEPKEKGWESGAFFGGLGKTFQWTSWGITLDANLVTPATDHFARSWGYWIGVGAGYRFHLN